MKKKNKILSLVAGVLLLFVPFSATAAELDKKVTASLLVDELETRFSKDSTSLAWSAQAWVGEDYNKAWFKTQGENVQGVGLESAEVQALYSRYVSDFFDLQAGLRYDFAPQPERVYGVVGIMGLAPQWFEVDLAAFVSDRGELSARFEAEYDLLITQKLVLQPALEMNVAIQDVPTRGIGSGINDLELGVRLRYEIQREFSPYIGLHWERKLGQTADFARAEGESVQSTSLLAGVQFWF